MWLNIATFAAAAALIVAGVALTIAAVKLGRAAKAADETIRELREDLVPLLRESRTTLGNLGAAISTFKDKIDRFGRLVTLIEELIGGGLVTFAASKAAKTSSTAVKGILEVMKVGLRAFRGPSKENEEVSENA